MNLLELLPKGKLWQGKKTKALFTTLGLSIKRLQDEAERIFIECFPDSSEMLLEDWKRLCEANSSDDVVIKLAATGGNTGEFFESIAKKFDPKCLIYKASSENQFIVGESRVGARLGLSPLPRFTVVFIFSVEERIKEAEVLLNRLKPAHVRFIYRYEKNQDGPFLVGSSFCGDRI